MSRYCWHSIHCNPNTDLQPSKSRNQNQPALPPNYITKPNSNYINICWERGGGHRTQVLSFSTSIFCFNTIGIQYHGIGRFLYQVSGIGSALLGNTLSSKKRYFHFHKMYRQTYTSYKTKFKIFISIY